MTSKKKLDSLIKEAGLKEEDALKLHQANGTADKSAEPKQAGAAQDTEPATRRKGGHGASVPALPTFGDLDL